MPDTFDLEEAFARLERSVTDTTVSPGAGAAIATAHRRRRRTTISGVAAAVLLVAGIAAAGSGIGHRDGSPEPAGRSFPSPAPLSARVLDDATAGWAGPWHNLGAGASPERTLNPSCTVNNDQSGSSSVSGGSGAFQTGDGHYVQYGALRWNDGVGNYVTTLMKALEACPGAHATDVTYSDDTQVSFVEMPSRAGSTTEWGLVRRGDDVLELALGPATGLSDEVRVRLADAMVAAIQADSALSSVPQAGVGQSPPEGLARFDPARLRKALGGWQSGWHDGQAPDTVEHDPCGSVGWNNAGITTTIGADGRYWIHQFSSPTAADVGYHRIRDALGQCPSYTMRTVTSPGGAAVLVARGDRDVWAIRHDDWVVVTYLPRAATPPPDSVSDRMGSAMVGVVEDAVAAYQRING